MASDRSAPDVSWQQLTDMTPAALRDTLPMVPWDLARLHRLDLPVRSLPVAGLAWLLELPLWQLDGVRFQVSPAEVRADPDRYPDHMNRAMAADLDHPVHVTGHRGRLVILDGYHRLLKAAIEGRARIDAMLLTAADLRSICVD
jgi:hypothetical protein